MVFHKDIFDHVLDQFSFLKEQTVDADFVNLAGDDWKLVRFLVETEEIDSVFFLAVDAHHFGTDLFLRQGDSQLLLAEVVTRAHNHFQHSHLVNQSIKYNCLIMPTLRNKEGKLSLLVHTYRLNLMIICELIL